MDTIAFQLFSTVMQLALALWLYARQLRERRLFPLRVVVFMAASSIITLVAYSAGFSLYPTLTDDASFFKAIASFAVILALMTGGAMALWEAPVWTALFCSSSAYLLQNMASAIDRTLHITGVIAPPMVSNGTIPAASPVDIISFWGSAALVYGMAYPLFIVKLRRRGLKGINNATMLFAVLVAMLVSIIFDLAIKDVATFEVPWRYVVVFSLVHLAVCAFILVAEFEILYNQALRTNIDAMRSAIAEQGRQFELSARTIGAINRRVHDIRHQVLNTLASPEGGGLNNAQLAAIAHDINVYDAAVRTGNAALDVIITEKSLLCAEQGITLTCVADGAALAFMEPADLYALVGTALEGAIGATMNTDDRERWAISLNVRERMGMAAISIEHYLPNPHEESLVKDRGGLALATMRDVVERHDGTLATSIMDGIFHLDILIPVP